MDKIILISLIAIAVIISILVYGLFVSSSHTASNIATNRQIEKYLILHKTTIINSTKESSSFNLSQSSNTILVDNFTYSQIINFSQNPGTMWKINAIISSLPTIRISPGISTYTATKNMQLIGGFNNTDLTINAEGHLIALEIYGKNDTIIFENGILFYPSSMPGVTVELGSNAYLIR